MLHVDVMTWGNLPDRDGKKHARGPEPGRGLARPNTWTMGLGEKDQMRIRAAGYRLAVVTAVAIGAAGCGGSGGSGSSSSSAAASTAAASSSSSAASGTPLTVVENEYSITPSKTSLPPGTYTFQISNEGKFAHNLNVSGPAVSAAAAPEIAPGQSGQLTVTLMKGSYELWCSIDGHKDLGMDIHLAVG